ncbi:MAG: hypothetical protein E3J83_04250 [Candidatus Atribacteria bacterium]|nr:MAG: hypothetical protein E3J83_04250 [Candidatus Atribacteria bacterium]
MNNEIIDFEKKGNVIRFYLGKNGKQWGDDWDDIPYEHNAGKVYDEYIKGYCDIAVDFDYEILDAADGFNNSPFSKEMMRDRKIHILFFSIEDDGKKEYSPSGCIQFGDKIETILKLDYVRLLRRINFQNSIFQKKMNNV